MSQTLNFFEQSEDGRGCIVSSKTQVSFVLPILEHPYARYGLAVALWKNKWPTSGGDEERLRSALVEAIESGLEHFRMKTPDDPASPTRILKFHSIAAAELRNDLEQVQSQGLAQKGIYLFPSVLTTDGDAKKTWQKSEDAIKNLREGKALMTFGDFKRSFAPMTAKINNGTSSQADPKGTLLEIACCCITTLTPHKPAAWPGQDVGNTVLLPDLNLEQLRDFIQLFEQMRLSQLDGDLWVFKGRKGRESYERPRLHNGNYPFAPYNAEVFGAVGLLAAIGQWALEAQDVDKEWARQVLSQVAGAPLYITSYAGISQVCFGHHIVALAMEGQLSRLLAAFYESARLYADDEGPKVRRFSPAPREKRADYSRDYFRLYLQTSRFLQQFSRPAFADFLSNRAEYPALCRSLLDGYFHHMKIDSAIVSSARALGQHLNRTAYFVAKEEYATEKGPGDEDKIRKAKAKILVEFESAVLSAKTSHLMLSTISTRAGRLLGGDLPSGAQIYMDATNEGTLELEDAKHLLIAYLRLRSPQQERVQKEVVAEDANISEATAEAPFVDDKE